MPTYLIRPLTTSATIEDLLMLCEQGATFLCADEATRQRVLAVRHHLRTAKTVAVQVAEAGVVELAGALAR